MKEVAEQKRRGNEVRRRMIQEIEKGLQAPYLFVTQYKGLSVKDLADLRQKLRPIESRYVVAKNTLSRMALKSLSCENLMTTEKSPSASAENAAERLAGKSSMHRTRR